jgi:3-oxoacyl-[acyl-carrier-protein] synthase II
MSLATGGDGCAGGRFCVTGIGVVSAHGTGGREAALEIRRRLLAASSPPGGDLPLADPDYAALLGPRGLRLMSRATQSLLAAARLAIADAGLPDLPEAAGTRFGGAFGTVTSNAAVVADFDRTTLAEGPAAVNPGLFPQTVWNGPAGQAAIRFGLHGANLTVCTGETSGLEAVLAALLLLRRGRERAMLAGGFEELTPLFRVLHPGGADGPKPPLSEGAAVLAIEALAAAESRGARPLAILELPEGPGPEAPSRRWIVGGTEGAGPESPRPATPAPRVLLEAAIGRAGGLDGALAVAAAAVGDGGAESVEAGSRGGVSLLVKPLR